jgi:hypothetical protein
MITFLAPITASMNGNQPGDPKLGIARMADAIKGEGMAKGKPVLCRMHIGTDAFKIIKTKYEEKLNVIK